LHVLLTPIACFTYPLPVAGISIMYDAPPLACRQAIVLSSVLPIRKYRKFGVELFPTGFKASLTLAKLMSYGNIINPAEEKITPPIKKITNPAGQKGFAPGPQGAKRKR
jgi:hypothetical protein